MYRGWKRIPRSEARNVRVQNLSMFVLWIAAIFLVSNLVHAQTLPDFVPVVEQNGPAVVNISTTQKVKQSKNRRHLPELPNDSPIDDFFRRFFGEEGDAPREYDAKSLGSGFIVSKDGYVLTNHHVVKDADEIIVRLSDRRELVAELVGTDKRSDVAVLKVEAEDLPTVKIGQSSGLKVGEWVLAIGSPFDFDYSVTAGIVSALGRSLPNENYVPFIQTDVAINPGNSGGPLFNMDGEVVGINAQIFSRTGGFMGLSFAIPIDLAMDVVDQIKTKGKVSRGWLGILIQDVTRELAESFGMDKPEGALVSRVFDDSPASDAGFQVGDVILEFAGRAVGDSASLPPIVGTTPVGKEVKVRVLRNGEEMTLGVTVGELPVEDSEVITSREAPNDYHDDVLALTVTNMKNEERKRLEIDEGKGVQVSKVDAGPARTAGIRRGDVILMIDNQDVENVSQFEEVAADLPRDKAIPMLVQRASGPIFLALKIPSEK